MAIPPSVETCWAELDATAKRERLLAAAGEVFAREGIEAPMPAIAAAAGAGVGSVYRQFPSKQDLLAALVIERHERVAVDADAALGDPGGAWSGLLAMLRALAARQAGDDVLAEAMVTVSALPDVRDAVARTMHSLEALLDAAKAEGCLRADATAMDLRLLFAATRAARGLETGAWQRMLELGIDALRADAQARSGR
ncbi:MAG TPA: TetR family transcriptional regulator [Solirubrobacterales bacterium]|jgi:AcrR family transcriptional regulator|nr:TetR family transcriptional regulator [Solirubrobacterales bacterium]